MRFRGCRSGAVGSCLSLATDAGAGMPTRTRCRAATVAARFAEHLGEGDRAVADAYYLALLALSGCEGRPRTGSRRRFAACMRRLAGARSARLRQPRAGRVCVGARRGSWHNAMPTKTHTTSRPADADDERSRSRSPPAPARSTPHRCDDGRSRTARASHTSPPLQRRDPIPWLILRTRMEQTSTRMERVFAFLKRSRSLARLNDRHCP